jgi:hypothetical protein
MTANAHDARREHGSCQNIVLVTRKARYQSKNSCLSVSECPLILGRPQPIRDLRATPFVEDADSLLTVASWSQRRTKLDKNRLVAWCNESLSCSTSITTVLGIVSAVPSRRLAGTLETYPAGREQYVHTHIRKKHPDTVQWHAPALTCHVVAHDCRGHNYHIY